MTASRFLKAAPAALLIFFLLPVCRPGHAAVEVLAVRNLDMTLDQERTTVTVEMPAAVRDAAGNEGRKLGLYLEGVEWGRTGTFFEVYANLPEGAAPKPEGPHYLGTLSSYGPKGGAGTTVGYDITHLVRTLESEGTWNGRLALTFVHRGLLPPPGQQKPELRPRIPEAPAVTRVRRVKIVRE
jgi:hypothetical protein